MAGEKVGNGHCFIEQKTHLIAIYHSARPPDLSQSATQVRPVCEASAGTRMRTSERFRQIEFGFDTEHIFSEEAKRAI
jgi:hypothetical protein